MWRYTYEREGNDCWLVDEFIYLNHKLVHIKNHKGWFGSEQNMDLLDVTPYEVIEYLAECTIDFEKVIESFKSEYLEM